MAFEEVLAVSRVPDREGIPWLHNFKYYSVKLYNCNTTGIPGSDALLHMRRSDKNPPRRCVAFRLRQIDAIF